MILSRRCETRLITFGLANRPNCNFGFLDFGLESLSAKSKIDASRHHLSPLCMGRLPSSGKFSKGLFMLWPVMQCDWIKVRSLGPHQHSDFGIDPNLVKQLQVAQGPYNSPIKIGWKSMVCSLPSPKQTRSV